MRLALLRPHEVEVRLQPDLLRRGADVQDGLGVLRQEVVSQSSGTDSEWESQMYQKLVQNYNSFKSLLLNEENEVNLTTTTPVSFFLIIAQAGGVNLGSFSFGS